MTDLELAKKIEDWLNMIVFLRLKMELVNKTTENDQAAENLAKIIADLKSVEYDLINLYRDVMEG